MRPILVTLVLLWQTPASASSILASTFGYNTTNATSAFQAAVGSANDTIIIDLQSADWNVGPSSFFDLTNKTLIFQPGVVLRALPGVFNSTGACLLRFRRCSNITVIGYGAEFIMNKPEYALLNDSEWRHTLKLDNCSGVVVKGLTLRDSGGDGIYVGGEIMAGSTINYSENVLIEDIRAINHYRQGMSITSVQNMLVRHCLFTGTNGTLPESGVDIEPYLTYQRIIGLVFEKCSFTDNDHCGIQVSMFEMDDTSLPIDITFRDCYIAENGRPGHPYGPDQIDLGDDDTPLTGNVLFERCHVDSSQWTAVNVRKPATSYNALFTDCAFTNVSQQQILYNTPIWVEVSDYGAPCPAFGGVQFANCLLTYDTQFPYLQCNGWNTSPGPQNVSFSGLVVGPNGAGVNITNSADTLNCLFVANEVNTAPPTTVGYALDQAPAEECSATPIRFSATRTAADISFPLPFRYDTSGAVSYGNDVHLMTGSLMIPSTALSANDTILARWDDLVENTEEVIIAPITSAVYTLNPMMPMAAQVFDCSTRVSVKVMLEGPYAGGSLMNAALRTLPSFPLTEPFTAAGYSEAAYVPGATIAPSVLAVSNNNAIVDWVILEMRPVATPGVVAAARAVLLQRDGDMVDIDGVSSVGFASLATGSYLVAVKPRNHLPVMLATTAPVVHGEAVVAVNFTLPGTPVYDTDARTNIGGVMALAAGDVTFNESVKYTGTGNDRDPILVRIGSSTPNATVSGYWREDVNLDGVVKYTGTNNDRDPILVGVGGTIPTNIRAAPLP